MYLNPLTNRMIKINSQTYRKLMRDSNLNHQKVEPLIDSPKIIEPIDLPHDTNTFDFKPRLVNEMTNIVAENKRDFKNITQSESDELLKRLLFDKLCMKPEKKIKKDKTDKKKMMKFKIRDQSSSESESSE